MKQAGGGVPWPHLDPKLSLLTKFLPFVGNFHIASARKVHSHLCTKQSKWSIRTDFFGRMGLINYDAILISRYILIIKTCFTLWQLNQKHSLGYHLIETLPAQELQFHGISMSGPSKKLSAAGAKGAWKQNLSRDMLRQVGKAASCLQKNSYFDLAMEWFVTKRKDTSMCTVFWHMCSSRTSSPIM